MPSRLAELEQLHVELNVEQLTPHTAAPHTADDEMLGRVRVSVAVGACNTRAYMWSPTVNVVDISAPHSQTDTMDYSIKKG